MTSEEYLKRSAAIKLSLTRTREQIDDLVERGADGHGGHLVKHLREHQQQTINDLLALDQEFFPDA